MMIDNEINNIVKHSGNITLDQVIKVANKLSGTVKEVLGTCQYIVFIIFY